MLLKSAHYTGFHFCDWLLQDANVTRQSLGSQNIIGFSRVFLWSWQMNEISTLLNRKNTLEISTLQGFNCATNYSKRPRLQGNQREISTVHEFSRVFLWSYCQMNEIYSLLIGETLIKSHLISLNPLKVVMVGSKGFLNTSLRLTLGAYCRFYPRLHHEDSSLIYCHLKMTPVMNSYARLICHGVIFLSGFQVECSWDAHLGGLLYMHLNIVTFVYRLLE